MAVITMSTSLILGRQVFKQRRFDISEISDATGKMAVRLFGPPKWGMTIGSPASMSMLNGSLWESMLLRLRGGVNVLAAWDVNKPAPLGTMRGTPTLSAHATAGATSIALTGTGASTTLKQGDWLQVGTGHGTSQLVKVVADVTFSGGGTGSVTIEPPIRKQINSGSSVYWDKSLGYYRMVGNEVTWNAVPGAILTEGYGAELLEDFG
jgi:hypothetical protein